MINRNTYELSFLALPELSESDIQTMQTELANTITKAGGEVASLSDVHFIDLEYTMTKQVKSSRVRYDQAYFSWVHFAIDPQSVATVEESVDSHDSVLRYLLVKTLAGEESTNVFTRESDEQEETLNDDQRENEDKGDIAAVEADTTSVASDDLTKIEGIGPKIAEVLTDAGIGTYAQLADSDVDELRSILAESGLGNHEPGTWSQQAQLADKGEWDKLQEWQEQLDGGK